MKTKIKDIVQDCDISAKVNYYEVMPVLYGFFRESEFESLDVPAWVVPKLDDLVHSGYLATDLYEDENSEDGIRTVYHIPRAFHWDLECLCTALARMIPDTVN